MEVTVNKSGRRKAFEGWQIPTRIIKDYEFVYLISGCGEIMIDGKQMSVSAGNLICFRPGVKHSLWLSQKPYMDFYFMHFSPISEELKEMIKDIPECMHLKEGRWLETLMKRVYEEYRQPRYLGGWKKEIMLQQILCELFTKLHSEQNPADVMRINKVLAYIHEDPCRSYALEDLLGLVDIKKTVFMQSFRRVTGTTPTQYINDLRLELAEELLAETNISVAQIGEMCGFADPFYFSRCFKRKHSVSPRKYRELQNS